MQWIIRSSLRLQFILLILAAALVVFGIRELRTMPIDVYPEFNPPMVNVQTEALGLSAAEVEALVTVPLEADLLNGVAWVDQIYSESVTGLSSIHLIFKPGTDPIRARQMVQERLTQTYALPNVSKPPTMLPPLSTTSRVMMVGLSSDKLSLIEIGVLARWNITPRLMGVPGVANVAIWGQRERQLQVQVDPEKLYAQGVTLSQVIKTTGEALWFSPLSFLESSSPGTAGWIDTPNQRLGIQHELPISEPSDLAQVVLADNTELRLGDVAKVVEDHQPLIGEAILKRGPGLLLVIEKFPGANIKEVTRRVEEALVAMRPGLTGIDIDTTIFRPATYIEKATHNLTLMLLVGTMLAILVFYFFFFEWRIALISAASMLLSLLTAGFVLYLRGTTFNTMTLLGFIIAIGVVMDDAVIGVENIYRRFHQNGKKKRSQMFVTSVILEATSELQGPLVFTTLMILLTVSPVFFMQGESGAFFQPFATSFVLAVLSSTIIALILTPVLSLTFSRAFLKRHESPLVSWLNLSLRRLLVPAFKVPKQTYIIVVVAVFVGLSVLPTLSVSLVPKFRQTDLLIKWEGPPGTSRLEMSRIINQASQELREVTGVTNVGAHLGRAITGDKVAGINSADLWISLDSQADLDIATKNIQEVIDGYPGLFHQVQTYQPKRTREALTDENETLSVRIYGHDLKVLERLGKEVRKAISGIDGVVATAEEPQVEEPQVQIKVDLKRAQAYGLKPGDIRRQATTLLSGIQVGSLYEDQKVFEVVVWGEPEIRNSLTDIRDLMIETPAFAQVPLEELAEVSIAPAPIIIKRDSVSRFLDVEARVPGRDLVSVAADIRSKLKSVEFPLEYHMEVLGASIEKQASRARMLVVIVTAAVGIFLLMQAAFGSWRLAIVSLLSLPMALVGGVLAAFLTGGILSLGSLVGFLTILGIAVRNSILLISHYQHLERLEGQTFGPKLILRGTRERLAPILATALALGLFLLPAVLFGNITGVEIVQPAAIVIFGGLITSTYLTLLVLPVLYLRFGKIHHG